MPCSQNPIPIPVLSQTLPLHVLIPYSFKTHFNTILNIHLGLKRGIYTSDPRPKPCLHLFSLPVRATSPAHLILLVL